MKKSKNIFYSAAIPLAFFAFSCASSKYSYKHKEENFVVTVQEDPDELKMDYLVTQDNALASNDKTRGLFAPFLGQGITIAAKLVKKMIDDDRKKYTYVYHDGVTDIYCYDRLSTNGAMDPSGFEFKGLTLTRTFLNKKNITDTAFVMVFETDNSNPYEILNNSFFRMKVKSVDIRYAAAKIPGARPWLPWTYIQHRKKDDRVNMDIELDFSATYVDDNGQLLTNTSIGKFYLTLRDFPLNPKSKDYKSARDSVKGKLLDGKCFLVPRSCGYYINDKGEMDKCYSQGSFGITAQITESGKEKFVDKLLFDESDMIIKKASTKATERATKQGSPAIKKTGGGMNR